MNRDKILMIAIILSAGVLQWLARRVSRRNLFYGVTVDPAFPGSAPARRIDGLYTLTLIVATLFACFLAAAEPNIGSPRLTGLGFLVMIGAQWIVIGWARRQAAPYRVEPAPIRQAALVSRPTGMPGTWIAWLLPLALPVLLFVLAAQRWDSIPAQIPMHWNIAGKADRWVAKSWTSVSAMAIVALGIGLALVAMGWQLVRSRQISAAGEAAESETSRRYLALRVLLAMHYLINFLFFFGGLQQLGYGGNLFPTMLLPVLVIGTMVLLALIWRRAQRMRDVEPPFDGTRDEHWHLGIFYANPRDPAVLVEQRIGYGYTLNMGRPTAWVILGLAVGPGLMMAFLR